MNGDEYHQQQLEHEQMTAENDFAELFKLDVSEHTEKKGKFTYLSWAWAHSYMAKRDADFDWWPHDYPESEIGSRMVPYCATDAGVFVRVTVKYKGKGRSGVILFDSKTKLPVSITLWDKRNWEGEPFEEIKEIIYNLDITEETFEFEIPEEATIIESK